MAIYEYQCNSCGKNSEFIQKMSDPPEVTCPHCGKDALERLISAAAFHLKGTGWYATDYKKKPETPKEKESSETKTETKTDSKSENPSQSTASKKSPEKSE